MSGVYTPQVRTHPLHRDIERYLAFVEEARKEITMPEFPTYEMAEARAEAIRRRTPETPGPGRYQLCDDRELAEILDFLSGDQSYQDEQVGSVDEGGWYARVGRFVCEVDSQGFFWYMDYEEDWNAQKAFARIEAEYEAQHLFEEDGSL